MYELKLYIVVKSKSIAGKIKRFRNILEETLGKEYSLEIVEVLNNPEQARQDNIFCTPTVVKSAPGRTRRIIGDLGDKEKVLKGLGLIHLGHQHAVQVNLTSEGNYDPS